MARGVRVGGGTGVGGAVFGVKDRTFVCPLDLANVIFMKNNHFACVSVAVDYHTQESPHFGLPTTPIANDCTQ